MPSSTKKALGPGWQDAGITRITDHAPIGSLSWLYLLYEFQNGWYICSQISILNMCNHLEYICPRVPGDITYPMVPISSSYIGLFQAKSSKKMGAHHTGDWPAGLPTTCQILSEWFDNVFGFISDHTKKVSNHSHTIYKFILWYLFELWDMVQCIAFPTFSHIDS